MSDGFTRGPLAVVDYGSPVPLEVAECQFSVQSHGAPVAYVYRAEDADLYSAAPDLLEAARLAEDIIDDFVAGFPDEKASAALKALRAAIAKATSQSGAA